MPEATEDLRLRWVPFDEAMAMVDRGEIPDAMSQLALERVARLRATGLGAVRTGGRPRTDRPVEEVDEVALVLGRPVDDRRRMTRALDDPGLDEGPGRDGRPRELVGVADVEALVGRPVGHEHRPAGEPGHRRERALRAEPGTVEQPSDEQ